MLGGRISYQHLDTSITNKTIDLPQYGNYTTVAQPNSPESLIGEAVFGSATTNVKHSITFTPMIGHSFENSYIYFGAGATLNKVSTDLNNGVGFADMKRHHTDVTGMPISLSNSKWVWGHALRIGATYFIDKSWAIDANYSHSTVKNTFKNRAYFSNAGNVGYADTTSTQRLTNQGVMFSINKHF
jgi:opacity protein-like surface antigen